MIRTAAALAVILVAFILTPLEVSGKASPPPPPPPKCLACQIPPVPAPPTIVPTVSPAQVPTAVPRERATLSPTRVRWGQDMRLVVRAAADNAVLATLQYWRSKPKTYRGKADAHGLYMRSFRIDKKAPLGKGSVRVTVTFAAKSSLTDVLPFTVVR